MALGKVKRQESQHGSGGQERDGGDEILRVQRGERAEERGADDAKAGAESVHVVHEVERVGDGENPEHGHGVTEKFAGLDQGVAHAGPGVERGEEKLSAEFPRGAKVVSIIQPTQECHSDGTHEDGGQLRGPAVDAVREFLHGICVDPLPVQHAGDDEQGHEQACQHGESPRQRDGCVVNLPLARIIDVTKASAQRAPERQRERRAHCSAESYEHVEGRGKIHGRDDAVIPASAASRR